MEEHANIGILRSISWKFEVNPSSSLGEDVGSSILTYRQNYRQTTEEHANIGILRSSSGKFEVNPSSSLGGDVRTKCADKDYRQNISIFLTDIHTDIRQKNIKVNISIAQHFLT